MAEGKENNTEHQKDAFRKRVRHYAEVLNPLFDATLFPEHDWLFQFVRVLVRESGMQDAGWDPFHESRAVLDDLSNLARLELPVDKFPDTERTRVRLSLLSYCHITEMDFPYTLLANLLRMKLKQKYEMNPFADVATPIKRKKAIVGTKPPSPLKKITRVQELAAAANLPNIGAALTEIYDNVIRNSVYHSDYTVHNGEMRLISSHRLSRKHSHYTPAVEFDELGELFTNAFAFYSALFQLYERCRGVLFKDFKNVFMPFDSHYKGLMEFIFDDADRLCGYRTYWPNGSYSEYTRTDKGCTALNLGFKGGDVDFMVGFYADNPGTFSPLVEADAQPVYAQRPGTGIRPHWPDELKSYRLPVTNSGEPLINA
jgi:hypothetical protein